MQTPVGTARILLSRSFLLSFLSFFFLWVSFDLFILFPLYVLRVGGDSVDIGIQTAIFFFPSVVIRPVAGWLTDRIGRLKVLWFGTFLMVVSAFAFLFLKGSYREIQWQMAAILFTRGLGFAAFYTAFFTYVVDLTTFENRARILGLFGVSGLVGHGIAPKVGEIVLHSFDFDGFFAFSGVLSLISLTIAAFLKEERTSNLPAGSGIRMFKEVTITKKNWMILPGAFTFGYVLASFNTFGAPYFEQSGKASVGYFFLAYGLTAGFVRIFLGGIADRVERWRLVTFFFILQAAGIGFIVFEPVQKFYLIGAVLAGGAHAFLFPAMAAMAVDAHPQELRGVVTSIFTAAIELGFSLGSYILGVIVAIEGYRFMFASCSAFAVAFAAYAMIMQFYRKRSVPADSIDIAGPETHNK